MIEKFFDGDLKNQIMKYCRKLESISNGYDVLIFMARKSICFYDALILNGEVKRPDRSVVITTSSRIFSYDCKFLKGKKIALLDDIVLKGTTLTETIKYLLQQGINDFDVYYIASQSIKDEKFELIKKHLKEPIIELDNSMILVLGNSITNYISASACSYNVDYPVFYMDSENGFFENYIEKNNCISVPRCNVSNKTKMYIQGFSCQDFFDQFSLPELNSIKAKEKEVILKLRIFYRPDAPKRKVVVIPIIVLPKMTKEEIRTIFKSLKYSDLDEMVENIDEDKKVCNMLNVIQYVLSYQLFLSIFHKVYNFKYSINNQDYIFPQAYSERIVECLKKCKIMTIDGISNTLLRNDIFELSKTYSYFFDFIGKRHKEDKEHTAKFSFSDVYTYCKELSDIDKNELIGYVSVLFDYAIDTGLVVPIINIQNKYYMRSYRLSEQYELQEVQFDLIVYMYNEYQIKTGKTEMNRILAEKLLVLFFKTVIPQILDEYHRPHEDENNPQNVFGIAYARFGPVVSDSSSRLGVSQDSYLTKRLFDESRSPFKRIYLTKKQDKNVGKIYVKEVGDGFFDNLPKDWTKKTRIFVNRYFYFEKLLEYYDIFSTLKYIKTFDQFLVISAIGNSKDNQLLSLAAELQIYQDKVNAESGTMTDIISAVNSIMDGVTSGVWKYICYRTAEYDNCCNSVFAKGKKEQKKFEDLAYQIHLHREWLNGLKSIEESPIENYIEDVKVFLILYANIKGIEKNDGRYRDYVNKFNKLYKEPVNCKKYLNSSILRLKNELYESIDKIIREKEKIDSKFIDIDRIEELFCVQDVEKNRNSEIKNGAEELMSNSVLILYEIIELWNYIIDNNEAIPLEITYKDHNANYLRILQNLFDNDARYAQRKKCIDKAKASIENVIRRLRELVYEINVFMFKINQYIMCNNTNFSQIQKFYIVRRDDGNAIEIDEILRKKEKEKSINNYFEFSNKENVAIFNKPNQPEEIIEQLQEYSGYTLIDYECTHVSNVIFKNMDTCYSKRVKKIVTGILNNYSNKIIKVTDREE